MQHRLMWEKAWFHCGITCNPFFFFFFFFFPCLYWIRTSLRVRNWMKILYLYKMKALPIYLNLPVKHIWNLLFLKGVDKYKGRNRFGVRQHLLLWQLQIQCGRKHISQPGKHNYLSGGISYFCFNERKAWWVCGESWCCYNNIKLFLLCTKA